MIILISVLLSFGFSSIYSVDIGSQNIRVAASLPGKPVEIKLNERDQRSTPNYLSFPLSSALNDFSSANWVIGSDAERIYYRNQSHGIANPFRKLWTPDNLDFHGLHPLLTASAALFHHLKTLNLKNDKLTLAVPLYTSPQYRCHLKFAARLIGVKSCSIIESSTAIGVYYSIEKIKKGSRKPITILFIDIGADNAELSLWKYKPLGEKLFMDLVQYKHSSKIGGRILDKLLYDKIVPDIGRPLIGSEGYVVINTIRKAKERLATGSSINVDLMEDFGKSFTITQEDVENLCGDMVNYLNELMDDISTPDEIELIGGSSRLQVFINAITKAFPDIPIRRSLNSDEAVALGAAYFTALKTGTIIGSKIEVKKSALFGLNATIDDENVMIFQPGDTIKSVQVPMNGTKSLIIKEVLDTDYFDEYIIDDEYFNATNNLYNEIMLQGIEKAMNTLKNTITKDTTPSFLLKFGLSPEIDTFDLIGASIVANVTVSRRSQAKKGCGLTNTKEVKISFASIPLDPKFRIPSNASYLIESMMTEEKHRLDREEKCHELEEFLIETRAAAAFESEMFQVTTQEERDFIIKRLDDERKKIDCTNLPDDMNSNSVVRLLRIVKADIQKPLERYEFRLKGPAAMAKLQMAIDRAEEARKHHLCDDDTFKQFEEYLNETILKLKTAKNEGPFDQPSFPVSEMKEAEKELIKKTSEAKRPPKKKDVINYSSSNETEMDDEEYEKLKKSGIVVKRPKKKRIQDKDPEVRALKEKRVYELEKVYNSSKAAFNQSRKMFVEMRREFELEHNLQMEKWTEPDEERERENFRKRQEYFERKNKKALKKKALEEERLRKENEKLQKNNNQQADLAQKRIEEEIESFKLAGASMIDFDIDENKDERVLYKEYKELTKKFSESRSDSSFSNEAEREKYMEERKKYETLRKRFENDPEIRRRESERKLLQKKRKEEHELMDASKTELDQKIEDLEIDQLRLEYDLQMLKEEIQDFEKLKKQILRFELHEDRKKQRKLERRKRKHIITNDDESSTSFYDEIPDFPELDIMENSDESSSDSEFDESTESSSLFSSSEYEETEVLNERRKNDFEVENRIHDKEKIRHLIDPENIQYQMTKKEVKEIKENGFKIPNPKDLYKKRFGPSRKDYKEEYDRLKRDKHRKPSVNPDDNISYSREKQDEELDEEL